MTILEVVGKGGFV